MPPEEDVVQRVNREHRAMQLAIAETVEAWAELENTLALLTNELVIRGEASALGSAIYYTPSAIELRLSLLDNIFTYQHGRYPAGARLLACWERILGKIGRARKTRNSIIHGNVVHFDIHGKQGVRLMSALFDFSKRNRDLALIHSGQMPGMSLHDVKRAKHTFGTLRDHINTLTGVLQNARVYPEGASEPPWRDTLLQLEGDLRTTAPRKAT